MNKYKANHTICGLFKISFQCLQIFCYVIRNEEKKKSKIDRAKYY